MAVSALPVQHSTAASRNYGTGAASSGRTAPPAMSSRRPCTRSCAGVDQRRRVEVPPIVSQPQVGDPHEVFLPLLLPAGPVAIGQWPKEVADSRARHRYDRPATEPGTKGELQVLAAPDLLIRVEAADVQEVRPVYGDSAADQRRRPERPAFGQCRLLDVVRHLDPNVPKTHRAKLGALSAWRLLLRTTAFVVRLR